MTYTSRVLRLQTMKAGRREMSRTITAAVVVLACAMLLGTAAAQAPDPSPYELRAYVDDVSTTDGDTYQYNMNGIRARYVCPYCGYSTYYGGAGQDCPNPHNVAGHPPNLDLVEASLAERCMSIVPFDLGPGHRDYSFRDTTGALTGRALRGKPFHPYDPSMPAGQRDYRSTLHLRTCNLAGADGSDDIDGSTHLRFMILDPGETRPCALPIQLANIDRENGVEFFNASAAQATKDQYIEIGINPHRVDNGDEWLIRVERTEGTPDPTSVRVQAASLLYGFELDVTDTSVNAAGDGIYITNSGAVSITLHHGQFDIADGTSDTWLFHFVVRSNTRLMPGVADVAASGQPNNSTPLTGWLVTDAFPNMNWRKYCWLSPSGGGIATEGCTVAETGTLPAACVIPANCVGPGIAAVQYQNEGDDLSLAHTDEGDYRFYNGWEWQYDWVETVTNEEIAQKEDDDAAGSNNFRANTGGADRQQSWVQYFAECRYFSSRVSIPPTGDEWAHSHNTAVSSPVEINNNYANVVIGRQLLPAGIPGIYFGEYGPGVRTPTREFLAVNRFDNTATRVLRCPFCGHTWDDTTPYDTSDDVCPFHIENYDAAPGNNIVGTAPTTYYTAGLQMYRSLAVSGTDETTGGVTPRRHVMPNDAVDYQERNYDVYPSEVSAATAQPQGVTVNIPRNQPPSVPATGPTRNFENDLDNDEGYRGGMIVHADARNYAADSEGLSGLEWDLYYRCPDCGQILTDPNDPNHRHPGASGCAGHNVCPHCGTEYHANATECPFCSYTLAAGDLITNDNCIHQHDLWCEEFDVADLQVSVSRRTLIRTGTPSLQIGRVQPGVTPTRPDTNIQNIANGFRAFPSDNSIGAWLSTLNEGNVTTPVRISSVYDPSAPVQDRGQPMFSRIEAPSYENSYARIAQTAPITRSTMSGYDPLGALSPEWDVYSAGLGAPGGNEWYGLLAAGRSGWPIPLGQPVGTYVGSSLCFLDTDADGYLAFEIGGGGGAFATTETRAYDPLADLPLEPVYDVVAGDVTIAASRIPQNDYFSADGSPVPIIVPGSGIQVIWAGNRPSAAGTTSLPEACAPGASAADIPSTTAAGNLLYTTAGFLAPGASDPLYRGYVWPTSGGVLVNPSNLTNDAAAGSVSSSPWALSDDSGSSRWAFWHHRISHPGGTQSTLRYDQTSGWAWTGSGPGEWIYASGLPKENLRSFVDTDGEHWLFWHTGAQGRQELMYRWDYTLGTTDNNEARVPVDNRAYAEWREDVFNAIDPRVAWPGAPVRIRKPSQSPFVYAKDPSVYLSSDSSVNLFFSGYARSEGQADICWTRFRIDGMAGQDPAVPNYGKLAFGRVRPAMGPYVHIGSGSSVPMPEEFSGNGVRQTFASRHMDWMVHDDGSGDSFATSPQPTGGVSLNSTQPDYIWRDSILDPVFCIGLIYDAPGDGAPPEARLFRLTWSNGEYLRARGVYRVTPVLYPFGGATLPDPPGEAVGSGYYLRDPSVPGRRVMMEINPATGTVAFTSPLFNVDNPDDPLSVFDDAMTLGGGVNLVDVALYGAYYPYVYRVTRNGANDDSPSAFHLERDNVDPSRLAVFWRRSYPVGAAPHFGRSAIMYKSYSTAIQVNRPSVTGISLLADAISGTAVTNMSTAEELAGGIIRVASSYVGRTLRVQYTSSDGVDYDEYHQVPGWSVDTPVPIQTGGAEGRVVVKPEVYTVNNNENQTGDEINAVRYWLFWTGLGSVYDMRVLNATAAGTTPGVPNRAGGDPIFYQSADVYTAVVSPNAGPVVRERQVSSVPFDPT